MFHTTFSSNDVHIQWKELDMHSAFELAKLNGHTEIAKYLKRKMTFDGELKQLMNEQELAGSTVEEMLTDAASAGELEKVKYLVRLGVNVNGRVNSGTIVKTPLIEAVGSRNLELIDFLIKNGAKINMPDDSGNSPLLKAITEEAETVKFLVTHGANVNYKNRRNGVTPLAAAARCYDSVIKILEMVDILLSKNVRVDEKIINELWDIYQENPRTTFLHAMKKLDASRYGPLIRPKTAPLPAVIAFIRSSSPSREKLLELAWAGLDINARDRRGNSALHISVYEGSLEKIKLLVEAGASAEIKNNELLTPLNVANDIFNGLQPDEHDRRSFFEYNIEHFHARESKGIMEAPPIRIQRDGKNIEKYAQIVNYLKTVRYVDWPHESWGFIRYDEFVRAVKSNDTESVKTKIEDIEDTRLGAPLIYAIDNSNVEMVRLLLENGANANYPYSIDSIRREYAVWEGVYPICVACKIGNMPIIETLIDYGAFFVEPHIVDVLLRVSNKETTDFLIKRGLVIPKVELVRPELQKERNDLQAERLSDMRIDKPSGKDIPTNFEKPKPQTKFQSFMQKLRRH
ncbi:Ankyrin repeats (3 copies) [uncultured archaeon]|nr:Ankyrin repeats (3 copies) [uncultured archaeon]